MLTVIGDLVEDVVVWTTGPTRRGTDNDATIRRSRGGSAANVAAVAAPLVETRFIGRVGGDAVGHALAESLAAVGVDVRVQHDGRTGTVVVVVDPTDGERTMYPDRGAATELLPVPTPWIDGTTVLHVPAYGLAVDPAASSIIDAIDIARRRAARLSIDVSAVSLVEDYGVDEFWKLIEQLRPEVLFANADEAAVLGLERRPPPSSCAWVIKNGPRPARVVHDDGRVSTVDAIPVDDVRDTTGAGDAFAAGFLASWMSDRDLVAACRSGHRTAAVVLTTPGAS